MSNLYWLQPGWTSAACGKCGRNIHADGGDPDWGYCYDCFSDRWIDDRWIDDREPEPDI